MRSEKNIGRIVGVLLLLHLAGGLIVPFILLHPLVNPPGFLTGAAGAANQVRAAVLLLFVGSAIAVAIASAAWPVVRRYSSAMACWLLALAAASFSLQAVDNAHILSMLSLSQEYAKAGAANSEAFQALAIVVGSARKWAHYSFLLVVGSWILVFYSLLYRFRLVPRALAGFGAVASVLQITGVSLRGLLGYPPETRLAMPLAPAYVALAVWLIVKGFDERHRPLSTHSQEVEVVGA
jgi:Domain of unknown function (DUF4386)